VGELMDAVNAVKLHKAIPLRFFFLLMGLLDKLDRDCEDIAVLFTTKCPNAKTCYQVGLG